MALGGTASVDLASISVSWHLVSVSGAGRWGDQTETLALAAVLDASVSVFSLFQEKNINPYLTNGFSHHYQMGESTFIFRGVKSDLIFYLIFR